MILEIKKELQKVVDSERIYDVSKFFKTGKGQYSEYDKFLGLYMQDIRKISKKFKNTNFQDLEILLNSEIHEERLLGIFILIEQFPNDKDKIYNFYLKNIHAVNNWDLVDLSADKILGNYLLNKDKKLLYNFSKSNNLWKRRISIIATFAFIKNNRFKDTLKISEILLNDGHDLIHKSVGWMLREVGKKDQKIEEKFLRKHYKTMPRTMLRYSIERFNKEKRKFYMKR